uniref:Uncharacterized protein n=1 Tax=Aegilops tauschii subsp. strangulata TaxID=200361 RepID=A0A452Z5S3_AEGTS
GAGACQVGEEDDGAGGKPPLLSTTAGLTTRTAVDLLSFSLLASPLGVRPSPSTFTVSASSRAGWPAH